MRAVGVTEAIDGAAPRSVYAISNSHKITRLGGRLL